jgi:hypothetical protein
MAAAIIGFLTALPGFVKLLTNIWTYVNEVTGNDPAGAIAQLTSAFSQLNAAKTAETHSEASKAIGDTIASFRK